MEKIKTILDRKPVSSEYINSKQDFNKVMDGFQKLKPPVMKSGWFYGTVGLATIAMIVTAVSMSSLNLSEKENLATKNSENTTSIKQKTNNTDNVVLAKAEKKSDSKTEPVVIAPVKPIQEVTPEETPSNERVSIPVEETTVEITKITQPHIAGVLSGPIAFNDFCDPMGVQVNEDIVIVEYTIHYFSCKQEVTAKIRGSKLPLSVCQELQQCGERIEVDFLYIKGYDKKTGNPVRFDSFTLIPTI